MQVSFFLFPFISMLISLHTLHRYICMWDWMCVQAFEASRGCRLAWSWIYMELSAASIGVLGIEFGFSRIASTCNWTISTPNIVWILNIHSLSIPWVSSKLTHSMFIIFWKSLFVPQSSFYCVGYLSGTLLTFELFQVFLLLLYFDLSGCFSSLLSQIWILMLFLIFSQRCPQTLSSRSWV